MIAIIVVIALFYDNKDKSIVKIGAVLALTGNNASYGQDTQNGINIALAELNKDGKQIEIVIEDDKSTAEGAVSAFRRIIDIEKLPIAIGFVSSNGILAVAPIAESSKVVALSTLAGSDDVKNAGDYVFRIREKSATHGEKMADYAKNILGAGKIALYYANAANGISYADAFKKRFEEIGGKIVYEGKYLEKSNDFRSELSKIKALLPDAIYLAGVGPDMGQILVQADELGIKTKWMASAGAENPKLVEIAKEKAEGLIFTTPAFNPNEDSDLVRKFTESYKQKYGVDPSFAAANGYDGLMLVYDVIKKYGYSSEKIKEGLYATKDYSGVGGPFSFDGFGEVEKAIMFKVVKDGKFIKAE